VVACTASTEKRRRRRAKSMKDTHKYQTKQPWTFNTDPAVWLNLKKIKTLYIIFYSHPDRNESIQTQGG